MWIATGHTDLRRGKILWHDGRGVSLYAKRPEYVSLDQLEERHQRGRVGADVERALLVSARSAGCPTANITISEGGEPSPPAVQLFRRVQIAGRGSSTAGTTGQGRSA